MTKRDVFSIALTTLALVLIVQFVSFLVFQLTMTMAYRQGSMSSAVAIDVGGILCLMLGFGILRWHYWLAGVLGGSTPQPISEEDFAAVEGTRMRVTQCAGLAIAVSAILFLPQLAEGALQSILPYPPSTFADWLLTLTKFPSPLPMLLFGLYLMTGAKPLLRFAACGKESQ